MAETKWFTRLGGEYVSRVDHKQYARPVLGSEPIHRTFSYGKPYDIDLAKGTAKFDYEDTCNRCGGMGGGSQWQHTGWVCFECGGSGKGGVKTGKLYTAEKLAKLNVTERKRNDTLAAKRQAVETARKAQADAVRQSFLDANPGLLEGLQRFAADWFLNDLRLRFERTGGLSADQVRAATEKVAKLDAQAAARAASQFVGTVGERIELTLTMERAIQLEASNSYLPSYARFAAPTLHICHDQNGNKVVYKGTGDFLYKGQTGIVKATISSHDVYRDENQTSISRPKVVRITQEASEEAPQEDAA